MYLIQIAKLSEQQHDHVLELVDRFQKGQRVGIYWQWRLEILAWWEGDEDAREMLFEKALTRLCPRIEPHAGLAQVR